MILEDFNLLLEILYLILVLVMLDSMDIPSLGKFISNIVQLKKKNIKK